MGRSTANQAEVFAGRRRRLRRGRSRSFGAQRAGTGGRIRNSIYLGSLRRRDLYVRIRLGDVMTTTVSMRRLTNHAIVSLLNVNRKMRCRTVTLPRLASRTSASSRKD